MKNEDETLFKTWDFKGIEIKPLSYARRFHISKLVDVSSLTPWDLAQLIYALSCETSKLIRGIRNRESFDMDVTNWIDDNKITMADFNQDVASMVQEIMENADANKAQPVKDGLSLSDPDYLGNV